MRKSTKSTDVWGVQDYIKRYLKQWQETGKMSVKSIPGRPSKKFAPLQAGSVAQLGVHPDATLEVHCQM